MNATLQILALIACAVIFFRAESVLNKMGRVCRFDIRLAFWLLAVGAVAVGGAIATGWQATAPVVASLVGVALLLHVERRARVFDRRRTKTKERRAS